MTTAIAQFMRELERVWDEHRDASIGRRDLAASLSGLAPDPSVWHLPAKTGAAGREDLERFYAEAFLPHLPADLTLIRRSRTVDRFHLVDETTVSFTHDRELPWLLPGGPDAPAGHSPGHRHRRLRARADPLAADPLGLRHAGRPARDRGTGDGRLPTPRGLWP